MIALLPPQNISIYSPAPTPIEYIVSVACKKTNDWDTFRLITDNSMTSQKTIIKNKVSEIDNLNDNWDGYNAIAPLKEVVKNTFKFIDSLFLEGYEDIDKDNITPTPYGSIVLDFKSDIGLVSIEIGKTQLGYFTEFINCDDCSSEGIDTDFKTIPDEIKELLNKLYERGKNNIA